MNNSICLKWNLVSCSTVKISIIILVLQVEHKRNRLRVNFCKTDILKNLNQMCWHKNTWKSLKIVHLKRVPMHILYIISVLVSRNHVRSFSGCDVSFYAALTGSDKNVPLLLIATLLWHFLISNKLEHVLPHINSYFYLCIYDSWMCQFIEWVNKIFHSHLIDSIDSH